MSKEERIKMIKRIMVSLLLAVSVIGALPLGASAKWKEDKYKNRRWIENGVMATGWKQIDGKWYNFRSDGVMQTAWLMDNGNWYYFWSDGTMAYNTWMTNGAYWYYFDASGKMVSDTVTVGNKEYDFKTVDFIFSKDLNKNEEKANSNINISSNN
jgi:hypothetical protein